MIAAAVVQAVATVVLLLVTGVYVWHTSRLVHMPHAAFLKPMSFDHRSQMGRWIVRVNSFSHNFAMDIELWAVSTAGELVRARGLSEIKPGQETDYTFDATPTLKDPFFVKHRSVTGETVAKAWLYDRQTQEFSEIEPIGPNKIWLKKIKGGRLLWKGDS